MHRCSACSIIILINASVSEQHRLQLDQNLVIIRIMVRSSDITEEFDLLTSVTRFGELH